MAQFWIVCSLAIIAMESCTVTLGDDHRQAIINAAQQCKHDEKASDEDVAALANGSLPETPVQKCLHACVQKQYGLSDGKRFSADGFLKYSATIVGAGEDHKRLASEIARNCESVSNDDRCQLGADIAGCIKKGLEKKM